MKIDNKLIGDLNLKNIVINNGNIKELLFKLERESKLDSFFVEIENNFLEKYGATATILYLRFSAKVFKGQKRVVNIYNRNIKIFFGNLDKAEFQKSIGILRELGFVIDIYKKEDSVEFQVFNNVKTKKKSTDDYWLDWYNSICYNNENDMRKIGTEDDWE